MPAELPVHVSRGELHAIELPGTFETEGAFDVRLVNHGNSLHMHLHLDDALSEVASLPATNHYVEGDTERTVRIEVDESRLSGQPVRGKLKVVSAYGAETRWVDVVLAPPAETADSVRVDESLAEPSADPAPKRDGGGLIGGPVVPVIVLAALAIAVAGVAVVVFDDVVVLGGAIAVVVGVALAIFLLLQG